MNNPSNENSVRYYCVPCESYISSKDHIEGHLEHKVVDLPEKCARFLADYQALSQMASLLVDRRQIHIKDESIDKIMSDIRKEVLNAKDNIEDDIDKSINENLKYLLKNPMVEEMHRVKEDLEGKNDEELTEIKNELKEFCKDLLVEISEGHYEVADKLIDIEKLKKYQRLLNELTEKAENDVSFIKEISKLKRTKVKYSYDPLAVLGMIRVESQAIKPARIMQFNRENNTVNIFNADTDRKSVV